jgi:hypothetical protein
VRESEVWTDVYSLLSASSSLSEFLQSPSRGERIRERTETEPESVLLEHEVRNSIIHFADRITDVLDQETTVNVVPRHISVGGGYLTHQTPDSGLAPMTLGLLQRNPLQLTVVARSVTDPPLVLNLDKLNTEIERLHRVIGRLLDESPPPSRLAQKFAGKLRSG